MTAPFIPPLFVDPNKCPNGGPGPDRFHAWTFAGFAPLDSRLIYVCPKCRKFTYAEIEFVGYKLGEDE